MGVTALLTEQNRIEKRQEKNLSPFPTLSIKCAVWPWTKGQEITHYHVTCSAGESALTFKRDVLKSSPTQLCRGAAKARLLPRRRKAGRRRQQYSQTRKGQAGPGIASMAELGPTAAEAAKSPDKSFPNSCTRFLSIQIDPQATCWVVCY